MTNEERQKRINELKKGLKIAGKVGGKLLGKAALFSARTLYKSGRFVYREYKKLEPAAKKKLHKGILYTGSVAVMFSLANKVLNKASSDKEFNQIENTKKNMFDTSNDNTQCSDKYNQSFKITDRKSFEKLYSTSLPLIEISMMPTEILVLDAYSDNGKTINTVGLGSYWFPEDGNPKSNNWVLFSKYNKTHQNLVVTGNLAMELVDGWYRHRENGRIFEYMFEELKGCDLKAHEFAAIATCMYNSEKLGKELCKFVKENYKDPIKCAHKIMSLKTKTCKDGILVRHTHEALMYLNLDNYVSYIPSFKVKEGVNSKGKKYYTTSVNQVSVKSCEEMLKDLGKGKLDKAKEQSKKICNYICKGGQTLTEIIAQNVTDDDLKCSLIGTKNKNEISFEEVRVDALYVDVLYKESLIKYQKQDYRGAIAGFKKIADKGFDGADLRSDMAATYFNLGEYDKCIEECRKVLETGERQLYPNANYMAGKAYEAKGCAYEAMNKKEEAAFNYDRSKKNYDRAVIMADENNIADSISKIYKGAFSRVSNRIDSLNKEKSAGQSQKIAKTR